MKKSNYIRALTIAGSDSGGGAGIQADLKTFSALGCYGMTAITSITAQNTLRVDGIYDLSLDCIEQQLRSVLTDIGADVIKIGMLHRSEIIDLVAKVLGELAPDVPIVVDPVMVAKSGDYLLAEEAVENLVKKIIPLATVITPNIPEASAILKRDLNTKADMEAAAKEITLLRAKAVVIKGGHFDEHSATSDDCLWEKGKEDAFWVSSPRIQTLNTHGTGCTFSAAIAAYLGRGDSVREAVSHSKEYLFNALKAGAEYTLGSGHGPVHHSFAMQHFLSKV
jgi:hydroxymethylpyrimidine/phosphomethylpyrimidine kinase